MHETTLALLCLSVIPFVLLANIDKLTPLLINIQTQNQTLSRNSVYILLLCISLCLIWNVYESENRLYKSLLVDSMDRYYHHDQALLKLLHKQAIKLDPEFRNLTYKLGKQKSFTENKKTVVLCVRDKNNNQYNYDTLMMVNIHELAHVKSKLYDAAHTSTEFHQNHQNLIEKAKALQIYEPMNVKNYEPGIA